MLSYLLSKLSSEPGRWLLAISSSLKEIPFLRRNYFIQLCVPRLPYIYPDARFLGEPTFSSLPRPKTPPSFKILIVSAARTTPPEPGRSPTEPGTDHFGPGRNPRKDTPYRKILEKQAKETAVIHQ